jgi:hypothetical protein
MKDATQPQAPTSTPQVTALRVGSSVMLNGYKGTVVRVCDWDDELLEIRLASGDSCVDRSVFDGTLNGCKILAI